MLQASEEGGHRPHVAGIAGGAKDGCFSVVLAGGYEDDTVRIISLVFLQSLPNFLLHCSPGVRSSYEDMRKDSRQLGTCMLIVKC